MTAGLIISCATSHASERDFLTLWQAHLDAPESHAEIATACEQLLARRVLSVEWTSVVRTLMGWRWLKAGRVDAATEAFEAVAAGGRGSSVERAAHTLARRWLTRLDRERVHEALRAHFARHIAYPASLDALAAPPDRPSPPLTDRFGEPWHYRLESFARLNRLQAHRYHIESRALRAGSDLQTALQQPYPGAEKVRVRRRVSQRPVAFEFEIQRDGEARRVTLTEGGLAEGIRFVMLAGGFALMTENDDYWLVVLPERRDGYGDLP